MHWKPIFGSNHGELSCIFALITGNNVEFNLVLTMVSMNWLRIGYWIHCLRRLCVRSCEPGKERITGCGERVKCEEQYITFYLGVEAEKIP